jgi:hypothetical protein
MCEKLRRGNLAKIPTDGFLNTDNGLRGATNVQPL